MWISRSMLAYSIPLSRLSQPLIAYDPRTPPRHAQLSVARAPRRPTSPGRDHAIRVDHEINRHGRWPGRNVTTVRMINADCMITARERWGVRGGGFLSFGDGRGLQDRISDRRHDAR